MNLLFLGDLVGRAGRDVVVDNLPKLRRDLAVDFVVANVENAAGGFGITQKLLNELFAAGVDCATTGNHVWDQKETVAFIGSEPRLLRPLNFPQGTPGKGAGVFQTARGKKVVVANLMGRLFMDPLDDPFAAAEALLKTYRLGGNADAILFDFHGEATSEKMAFGHFLDGRVSFVVGTHTHVPTADHMVLEKGTAYQSDAGMCGDYDSVIGMEKANPVLRFTRKLPTERLSPANGAGTMCGVLVETDDATGLARRIAPVRVGGKLEPALPKWASALAAAK
ncbi:TIGR00282 family metallophosphoesterase [Dongia rigui]|uniref:TIGR00282 family metallophosphoesterase n=1 Tax=Dongia rigui TaxID=940149 RepID=A0ABU5E366_9PROT|nr:TIGR00282 family metallophosphoesterase [Dongia rigui]MDY0873256.1 TIGR00282 family metallophosphoesterase [Dongia rigui]